MSHWRRKMDDDDKAKVSWTSVLVVCLIMALLAGVSELLLGH